MAFYDDEEGMGDPSSAIDSEAEAEKKRKESARTSALLQELQTNLQKVPELSSSQWWDVGNPDYDSLKTVHEIRQVIKVTKSAVPIDDEKLKILRAAQSQSREINILAKKLHQDATDAAKSAEAKAKSTSRRQNLNFMPWNWDVTEDDVESARRAADIAVERANATSGEALSEFIAGTFPPFFKEQCFLLSQIPAFAHYKVGILDKTNLAKRMPYTSLPGSDWVRAEHNACLQVEGDPFAFMNHLTQFPGYGDLLNIKTSEISNLQPMIRLYKIKAYADGTEEEFEIPFDSYFTKRDLALFKDRTKRGAGVGIQDFTFSYEADNPFALKKSIKASLSIFANDFDELLTERQTGRNHTFKYVDLALKTGRSSASKASATKAQNNEELSNNLDKLDFRLKAVVGWASKAKDTSYSGSGRSIIRSEVKDAIYNSYVTLNLTPTVHDFDIDENGRVVFKIQYLAYVEDFFDQPSFNIFSSTEPEKRRLVRKIKTKVFSEKCESEHRQELKKSSASEIDDDKKISLASIVTDLSSNGKIRFVDITDKQVREMLRQGPFYKMEDALTSSDFSSPAPTDTEDLANSMSQAIIENDLGDNEKRLESFKSIATEDTDDIQTVPFFYVSDLIDVILQNIGTTYGKDHMANFISNLSKDPGEILKTPTGQIIHGAAVDAILEEEAENVRKMETQFKKLRVLLGPLEIKDQSDINKTILISMGDLPISIKYFTEWMSRKMAKRGESYYPLPKFLNDFFNNLISEFLNEEECFGSQAKQRTRVSQASLTSYKNRSTGVDEITDLTLGPGPWPIDWKNRLTLGDVMSSRPLLRNISGRVNSPASSGAVGEEINYLAYYAGRSQPSEKMNGNIVRDHSRGIFHYSVGKDRGIVKAINLKRTDSTGLKELRFEQDGYDGLSQLREVYDIDIKTFTNVNAYPGVYIYVDPAGFSPSVRSKADLTQIGIGGYHMIVRSEHSFGPGRAETSISAKWVASITPKVHTELDNVSEKDTTNAPSWCSIQNSKEVVSKS